MVSKSCETRTRLASEARASVRHGPKPRSRKTPDVDVYLASIPSTLLDDDPAVAGCYTAYTFKVVWDLGQECSVSPAYAFPGIQIYERRPAKDLRFGCQDF